ncbi:uncharacterized protein N7506_009317 [Penicillium brevicompactum]|uniref:uncharacterized protein n=1 Tax=Penicillium brevicompactum TaxID=5074 RepID=UPI0025411F4E|nr:uncharacterized protein N7506_009317 [Penicillium brevicompactum]KAJ5326215.1 hypothetical protein N7506_009317 [Penicillium brevicompactum]
MSTEERQEAFSHAVAILAANFPDTHSADVGHQAASWAHCERSIPHVAAMLKKSEEFQIFENLYQPFAELLLRCSWYLYERENYSIALSYIDGALKRFSSKDTLAYASEIDLRGLIHLDICHFTAALEDFEEAFKIRTKILADGHSLLAASQVNIGLALTELGEAIADLRRFGDQRRKQEASRLGGFA